MKVHELIAELSALSASGLRDAEVEVAFFSAKGIPFRRSVTATERSNDRQASVLLRATRRAEAFEVEG